MTLKEHLIAITGEEGCEVGQVASKILRFSIDDRNVLNPTGPTNGERLVDELNDILAMAEMLVTHAIIPQNWQDRSKQDAKRQKVIKFLEYSKSKGTLL